MAVTWFNSDGLEVRFGTDEATASVSGEYNLLGKIHEVELKITATALTSTAGTVLEDFLVIPKGARIHEIEVVAETACTSGGSATLDVGLKRTDRSTQLDYDGFVAALALTAIDAAGEINVLRINSTSVGALVGTTLANNGYLCANYNTAAFTAGVIIVRVRFYMP